MPRIDVVVIGAGAIGASVAWHLARAGRRVMVLEKESGPALHQSGRNSGVVHAGYNVKPGTAKARFCIEGNRQLRAYCAERGIPLEVGGILVVARTEPVRAVVAELHQHPTRNDVVVRMLDAESIRAADTLAGALAPDMRVIPFRGYYAELAPARRDLVRSHIYPAPDLSFPFLGVHLSRRTDGRVIVGPGAMLALGREAYSLWSLRGGKLGRTLGWGGFWRMMARREFRRLIRDEVGKSLSLRAIWKEARLLVPELQPEDLVRSYAGNRAQMVDRKGQLVEDMVVRETPRAVHVLNAVSPGLTCSLPFGEHLAALAAKKLDP